MRYVLGFSFCNVHIFFAVWIVFIPNYPLYSNFMPFIVIGVKIMAGVGNLFMDNLMEWGGTINFNV